MLLLRPLLVTALRSFFVSRRRSFVRLAVFKKPGASGVQAGASVLMLSLKEVAAAGVFVHEAGLEQRRSSRGRSSHV